MKAKNPVPLIVAVNLYIFAGTIVVITLIVAGGKWHEPVTRPLATADDTHSADYSFEKGLIRGIVNSDAESKEKAKLLLSCIKPGMDYEEIKDLLRHGPEFSMLGSRDQVHMFWRYDLAISIAIGKGKSGTVTAVDLIGAKLTSEAENEIKALIDSTLEPKEKGKRLAPYLRPGLDVGEVMRLFGEDCSMIQTPASCAMIYSEFQLSIDSTGDIVTSANPLDAE